MVVHVTAVPTRCGLRDKYAKTIAYRDAANIPTIDSEHSQMLDLTVFKQPAVSEAISAAVDMSPRVLVCDLCIMLLYGLSFILAEEKSNTLTIAEDKPDGNCSCGGFPTSVIDLGSQPLLSQTPGLVVKCDDEGANTCKSLCNALATATKAKGPEVLCNRLKNAKELKLSAFYQICDKPWTYADLTADEPLCCEESKVKTCPSVEKTNSTDTVDAKTVM